MSKCVPFNRPSFSSHLALLGLLSLRILTITFTNLAYKQLVVTLRKYQGRTFDYFLANHISHDSVVISLLMEFVH